MAPIFGNEACGLKEDTWSIEWHTGKLTTGLAAAQQLLSCAHWEAAYYADLSGCISPASAAFAILSGMANFVYVPQATFAWNNVSEDCREQSLWPQHGGICVRYNANVHRFNAHLRASCSCSLWGSIRVSGCLAAARMAIAQRWHASGLRAQPATRPAGEHSRACGAPAAAAHEGNSAQWLPNQGSEYKHFATDHTCVREWLWSVVCRIEGHLFVGRWLRSCRSLCVGRSHSGCRE